MAEYTDTIINVLKQLDLDIPESIRTDQRLTTWLMYQINDAIIRLKATSTRMIYQPVTETGEIEAKTLEAINKHLHAVTIERINEDETKTQVTFMYLNRNKAQTEYYFSGSYADELGATEHYAMVVEINEETGTGAIASIKDTAGTETIENWEIESTVVITVEPL